MEINPQLKNPKFYFMIVADVFLFIVALCASYLIRFEFNFTHINIGQISSLLFWIVPLKIVIFLSVGLYRGLWRFTGVRDFWLLGRAIFVSTALIMLIILFTDQFQEYSRGVFIADGIITLFLIGGVRMAIRSFYAMRLNMSLLNNGYKTVGMPLINALIIGAGQAGEKILREIMDNEALHYHVVGFVDDDPEKQKRTIHGIPVLGDLESLPAILKDNNIQQILIAVPSANGDQIRRIVEVCQQNNTAYKILPGIGDLIDGRVSVKLLRDISYEDLLGRAPVQLNIKGIRDYLDGKAVLITGCGGSIGSELCRQVVKYQPRSLILVDASEYNLFQIHMEMQNENYFRQCTPILARTQNVALMNDVFVC